MTIAGLNILRYTARLCVRSGVRPIFPVPISAELHPLIEGIYKESCVAEGKPEVFDPYNVTYYGNSQRTYAVGIIESLARTGCSLYLAFGGWSGDSDISSSAAARIGGAIVVMGTARYYHQGSIAMLADYPAFMEDIYVLGAIASEDEVVKSSVMAEDWIKLLLIILVVATPIMALAGLPVISEDGWLFQ
jgi:hypothetical protein